MEAQVFNLSSNRQPSYTNRLTIHKDVRSILFNEFATTYLSKCRKTEKAKKMLPGCTQTFFHLL